MPVGPLVRGVDVGVAVGVDLGPVPVVGAPVLVVGIVLVPAEVPVGAPNALRNIQKTAARETNLKHASKLSLFP